jgi:tRNA threonylcarbamoyladenosine biosynthesis protein TsaB
MKFLGIDTSTATASVALVEDGGLIVEELREGNAKFGDLSASSGRLNHAEILLPLIERLVKRANVTFSKISAFAVSIGPGSFTGLRIGLCTVKGLSYGWGTPVVGVPTLLAVAARATNWKGLICPFLDARRKEVYTALFYKKEDKGLERLTGDLVCPPEQIIREIQSYHRETCLFIGDGTRVYKGIIEAYLADRAMATLGDSYPSTAFSAACIAEEKVKRGEFDSPGLLAPLYLRPSEAELKKRS